MSLSEGQVAVGVVLASFVGTVALTRTITRVIRARQNSGGVFKISTLTACMCTTRCGDIAGALTGLLKHCVPAAPWPCIFWQAFWRRRGISVDEFAMWVHMRDVYWQKEGRASISALAVAAAICTALLIGINPLEASPTDFQFGDKVSARNCRHSYYQLPAVYYMHCKGKLSTGIVGILYPLWPLLAQLGLLSQALGGPASTIAPAPAALAVPPDALAMRIMPGTTG